MAKGPRKRKGQKRVLSDHKQVGRRLVPPMMQIQNVQTFSFVDSLLPDLVWLSALFLRCDDRVAVDQSIEFLRMCHEVLSREDAPALAHFRNFLRLSEDEKAAIRREADTRGHRQFLCEQLGHQHRLMTNYPLAFLFDEPVDVSEREMDIDLLSADVDALLDRYSQHATKVQTTAFVALMATGKLHISSEIDMPDPNSIFTDPDSPEAQRVASFVRANTNSGIFSHGEDASNDWAAHFWKEAHSLRGCS